jgi:hypothetical protein
VTTAGGYGANGGWAGVPIPSAGMTSGSLDRRKPPATAPMATRTPTKAPMPQVMETEMPSMAEIPPALGLAMKEIRVSTKLRPVAIVSNCQCGMNSLGFCHRVLANR